MTHKKFILMEDIYLQYPKMTVLTLNKFSLSKTEKLGQNWKLPVVIPLSSFLGVRWAGNFGISFKRGELRKNFY